VLIGADAFVRAGADWCCFIRIGTAFDGLVLIGAAARKWISAALWKGAVGCVVHTAI